MKSDLEIARETKLRPIGDIATKLDIPIDALEPYGRHKAKIGIDYVKSLESKPDGALVLVTGISPTPAIRAGILRLPCLPNVVVAQFVRIPESGKAGRSSAASSKTCSMARGQCGNRP